MSRRYAALLRGVYPNNCKMSDLAECFRRMGFRDVRTVLGSGNVVFSASAKNESALERKIERGMEATLPNSFPTLVRTIDDLEALLERDPFAKYRAPAKARRVVSFLREAPATRVALPIDKGSARIHEIADREVFTTYVSGRDGPAFMALIERTFGKGITTRTWETVQKIVKAGRTVA